MTIDFESVKKQSLTKDLLLSLIEKIYLIVKNERTPNIILNEFVDNMSLDNTNNIYQIILGSAPLSINDILIVSESGDIIITPNNIIEINKNIIKFTHPKIKNKLNFFVTYKY